MPIMCLLLGVESKNTFKNAFAGNEIVLLNGNGKTFHDEAKTATTKSPPHSTGINEKTSLLQCVNNSNESLVADDANRLPFANVIQSKRKYNYGIL